MNEIDEREETVRRKMCFGGSLRCLPGVTADRLFEKYHSESGIDTLRILHSDLCKVKDGQEVSDVTFLAFKLEGLVNSFEQYTGKGELVREAVGILLGLSTEED